MTTSRLFFCAGLFSLLASSQLAAQEEDYQLEARNNFEASLTRQSGHIQLPGDIAHLDLDKQFNYLSPEDTRRVLEEAWQNPPGELTLGMIIPAQHSVLDVEGWGVVIEYSDDGHISDDDANAIDYSELLSEMQSEEEATNEQRRAAGYPATHIVGWAAPPYYDAANHKLHWAQEINFDGSSENTLNYKVRVLGREGYLLMNAVGGMSQLDELSRNMGQILETTNFNNGHQYNDFDPKYDKVAAYGIGALVAGKLAAKAGLFAKLGALLIALKKFAIFIFIGIAALLRKVYQAVRGRQAAQ